MSRLHPYLQADLKYTINNSKCNFRYYDIVNKYNINNKSRCKTKKQSGGFIFGNGKYKFDFVENDLGDIIMVFIGNKENCLTAIIKEEEPNIVDLNGFSYYKSCNITKDLERNIGTKKMLEVFIDYIKSKYKNIEKIILSDNTEITCNNKNYISRLPLYNLYLFKYGYGYYEKYLNFKLVDDNTKQKHLMNLEKYKLIKCNKKDIYDFLLKIFGNNEKKSDDVLADIEEFIGEINNDKGARGAEALADELVYKFITGFNKFKLCHILIEFLDYIMTENKLYKLYGSVYEKYIN